MPSRFGFRHAVLAMLLLALTVSVWLNMLQLDRVWERLGEVKSAQARLEEAVVRLERRAAAETAPSASAGVPAPALSTPLPNVAPADAWARPGVPVKRVGRSAWINDPTGQPDYQQGGIITEGLEIKVGHVVPYRGSGSSTATTRVLSLVQERLADFNPKTLAFEGVLAEAWQMDPAGLWLRVKIRDDAVWSDGEPVSADDAAFTYGIIRDPKYPTAMFRAQFEAVSAVEVLGPKVLEITFSEALAANEDATLRLAPLPRHIYTGLTPEQFASATGILVGSGPYMLANAYPTLEGQWTPEKPLELVRNPRWRGAKRPADGFRFTMITDAGARLAAMKNRDADVVRGTPEHMAALAASPQPGLRALAWMPINSGPAMIVWNAGKRPDGSLSPCAETKVRVALTHALDRERMNRELFGAAGRVVSGPFPVGQPAYDASISPLPFDAARAAVLLSEAGWTRVEGGPRTNAQGTPLRLRIVGQGAMANSESWSAYLRDSLGALGIECSVELLDTTAYGTAQRARDFDGIIAAWSPDSPEPNMKQRYHSASIKGGSNDGQWSNPEADRLIDAARRTLDPDARATLWREFHALVHREQPVTFVASRPLIVLVSERLGNVPTYPLAAGSERAEVYVRKEPAPAGP